MNGMNNWGTGPPPSGAIKVPGGWGAPNTNYSSVFATAPQRVNWAAGAVPSQRLSSAMNVYGASVPGSIYGNYALGESMYGVGGTFMPEEIHVTKIFSSRRDLKEMSSAMDFGRRCDSQWQTHESTASGYCAGSLHNDFPVEGSLHSSMTLGSRLPTGSASAAPGAALDTAAMLPKGSTGAAPEEMAQRTAESATTKTVTMSQSEETSLQNGKANPTAESPSSKGETPATVADSEPFEREVTLDTFKRDTVFFVRCPSGDEDDIPIMKDDVAPNKLPEQGTEHLGTLQHESPQQAAAATADGVGRHRAPSRRPRIRSVSRTANIDVVDFPQAEEIKDDVSKNGLLDLAKVALDEARRRQHDERLVAREVQRQQRATVEEAEKRREELARLRRAERESEERHKRQEQHRLEEQRRSERAAVLAAQKRAQEMAKQHFEDTQQAEMEKEKARIQAIMESRNREMAKEEEARTASGAKGRSASRPRSQRQASRSGSLLRGVTPDQPPDNIVRQIRDDLANELASGRKPILKLNRSASDGLAPRPSSKNGVTSSASLQDSLTWKLRPQEASPETAPATSSVKITPNGSTQQAPLSSGQRTENANPPPSDNRNPFRTLALVECMRAGNNAVTRGTESITYGDQTVEVTEVKNRSEGTINYTSEVVQELCTKAADGYNVAVLSSEAPNTSSRFCSPVWPVLVRIVRTVLERRAMQGAPYFQLKAALAYIRSEKARDLFKDSSSFDSITLEPSPICGSTVSELQYIDITDCSIFEEQLSDALLKAASDTVMSSFTDGFIGAFVQMRQAYPSKGQYDLFLSSITVTAAGCDVTPYMSALQKERCMNASLLHLATHGPCMTCYMMNIADDDTVTRAALPNGSRGVSYELQKMFTLLQIITQCSNLTLRSGSVRRFLGYVSRNYTEASARIDNDTSLPEDKKNRLRCYISDSELLIRKYKKMLEETVTLCTGL